MLAFYKILILDAAQDPVKLRCLKELIYSLTYMDNGAITGMKSDMEEAAHKLDSICELYKFLLQQFTPDHEQLQQKFDEERKKETAITTKLLGMQWNRREDVLPTAKLNLDSSAKTKRLILSSIASQYDIYGLLAPLLICARLFLHTLQKRTDIQWDDEVSSAEGKSWRLICRQANSAPEVGIDRSMGKRSSTFSVHCYAEASKVMYATVIYLREYETGKISFLTAKNKIVNSQLELKSIRSLEPQAIFTGVELVLDICRELTKPENLRPINFSSCYVYTDSQISLCWLKSFFVNLDKMQKHPVFVKNRLDYISKRCTERPIIFKYDEPNNNPADTLTRPCSSRQLQNARYLSRDEVGRLPDA